MASKRKASEGITLLSTYDNEEEESEDEVMLDIPEYNKQTNTNNHQNQYTEEHENYDSRGVSQKTLSMPVDDEDLLGKFLPPPPVAKCSDELQEKINNFLDVKKQLGKSFNAEIRNRKDYSNPEFLLQAVRYQDIDQIGSCFSKDVFDPHGFDKRDFYDELEADMKREMERTEQEKKKNQRLDFVPGGFYSHSHTILPTDSVARQNKKSRWDKVDGDRKNPLHTGGKDALSKAAAHAVLLSAAHSTKCHYQPAFQ